MSQPPPLPSRTKRQQSTSRTDEKKEEQPKPVLPSLPSLPSLPQKKLPPPPKTKEIAMKNLEDSAKNWIKQRRAVISLIEEMITKLNNLHTNSTYAKIGGRTGSLAGFGVAAGGVILAPVTGGLSLLAVLPGLAVGAGGVATSTGASVTEWHLTREHLKTIQGNVEYDTMLANDFLEKVRVLGAHDPECDSRYLFTGDGYVAVIDMVYAISGVKQKKIQDKDGISDSTIKGGMVVGAKILCGFNPIISVPLDLMLIADDMETIKKKEPSSLAEVLVPVVKEFKEQLSKATGKSEDEDY